MGIQRKASAVGCVAAMALGVAVVTAAPASAASFNGEWFNGVTKKLEGQYAYVDSQYSDKDGILTVSNVKNGYHVRVKFYAQVNGVWHTYLNKILPDGYVGGYDTGYPPARALVRMELCTLDKNYVQRGQCENAYTINIHY